MESKEICYEEINEIHDQMRPVQQNNNKRFNDLKPAYMRTKEFYAKILKQKPVESATNKSNSALYDLIEHPLRTKFEIDICTPLQSDISKILEENAGLLLKLSGLEAGLSNLNAALQSELHENQQKEKELANLFEKRKQNYDDQIQALDSRLTHLNTIYSIYEKCLKLSIHKEAGAFICSALGSTQETIFSFTSQNTYTTYTPVKVFFPPCDFLSHRIEDLNKNELSILFTRLLKIIHTKP